MSDLKAIPGELRATIHVTRKATGKIETYEIVGHADPEKLEQIQQERRRKVHATSGAVVGAGANLTTKE